jgi:competence protein ComEC
MKYFSKNILCLLLILLIIFRYFSSRPVYKNGDTIRVTATVFSDPINYGDYQTFSAAGIKIYLPAYPEIYYGDKIVVEGVADSGKIKKGKLISVNSLAGFGSGFRKKIIEFYQEVLPQPVSGLVAGITLGSKGTLTSDFWTKVKKTGVAHVVVASGTNVTFLISFIFGVSAIFVSRRKSIPIVILSIVLYLFLSGFQAPLIRASIMAFLTFWAELNGRLVKASRVLFLTAGIMLLAVPSWIADLGFILSFVSTASIMIFEKKLNSFLKFLPNIMKEAFSVSLAAQIGVAPILFATFGQFNILSPLINALVLWTVPYIMILGSIGGVVGLIFPALGKLILYVNYPLAWWFTQIVILFDKF